MPEDVTPSKIISTPREAADEELTLRKKANSDWRNWQVKEAELKEAEATATLNATGTIPEKAAKIIQDPKVKLKKTEALDAQYNYKNALAEADTMHNIFLVLHAESKQNPIMEP